MEKNYGGYELNSFPAEFYDIAYDRILSGEDIPFYIDYSRYSNGRTLELGCGTGRVLIPTAQAGYPITGLDLSTYMLDICRKKLSAQTEEVRDRTRLIQASMTDFNTGETYSLVTIPFRAFQHLISTEDQRNCLQCVHNHLESGGKLVIDVFSPKPSKLFDNPSATEERETLPETLLPDGRKVRRTNRNTDFHRGLQYIGCEIIYYVTYPDGKQERLVQEFPMRFIFRFEMEHLLELCGFKLIDLFGNFDRSPYSDNSPEIITVAEKRG